jgi:hypothetical protein
MAADRGGVAINRLEYQRQEAARHPVRLGPRPVFLAGREGLLAELDDRLAAREDQSGPQLVALCGLGVRARPAWCWNTRTVTWWKSGWPGSSTPRTRRCWRMSLGSWRPSSVSGNCSMRGTPVDSVHGVLAAYPAEWLLIFDNAADRKAVERFLPPTGRGRVLITSQNQNWPHGQPLQVPVLGTDAAADFLVRRTGDPDRQAAADLARELDGLPLALEQAAAYILATGGTLAGYLGFLRQRRADMLGRGEPTGYPGTVATTWALAFAQLEQTAPSAVGMLRLLACCAPEAFPLRLLFQPRPGLAEQLDPEVAPTLIPLLDDRLAADDAIVALRHYSLVTPAPDRAVSVHRLVQTVTVDQMPTELVEAWRQAAGALIEAALLQEDPTDPGTWPAYPMLLPHAQAVLAADSAGMRQIAAYLGSSGSYVAARDLSQRVLQAQDQVYGPEHQTPW